VTLDPNDLLAISGLILVGGATIGVLLSAGGHPQLGKYTSFGLAVISGLFQIEIARRSE